MNGSDFYIPLLVLFAIFAALPASSAISTILFYWRNGLDLRGQMPVRLFTESEGSGPKDKFPRRNLTRSQEAVVLGVLTLLAFFVSLALFLVVFFVGS